MRATASRLTFARVIVAIAVALFGARTLASVLESRFVLVSVADATGLPIVGLGPDDLTLENGGARCQVVAITPASYPLAIILDTSSHARTDFRALQDAAVRLADGLAPRDIAVYTSGEPATRVLDFTADRTRIARAMRSAAAAPNSAPHTMEAILRASQELGRLHVPASGVVMLSAGGTEMSPPTAQQVFEALRASGTILNAVEERTFRIERGAPQQNQGDVIEALAARVHGKYVRGTSPAVFAAGIAVILLQLEAQSVVEYEVAAGSPRALIVNVKPPAVVVMAQALEK